MTKAVLRASHRRSTHAALSLANDRHHSASPSCSTSPSAAVSLCVAARRPLGLSGWPCNSVSDRLGRSGMMCAVYGRLTRTLAVRTADEQRVKPVGLYPAQRQHRVALCSVSVSVRGR